MNFEVLYRLAPLRERLGRAAATASGRSQSAMARHHGQPEVDLFITQCEVNDRQGTGVLLQRLFGDGPDVVSIRSKEFYGGGQTFGVVRQLIAHGNAPKPQVYANLLRSIGGLKVRRILCVPFDENEIRSALAAADLFGATLCTWIMDDQNIDSDGIPDASLRALLARSALRLAISPELLRAYQAKFGTTFALAPPAVQAENLQRRATLPTSERLMERRGLLFGNIWGERWLDDMLGVLNGSGIQLDWHHGGGTPWFTLDAERLERCGVTNRPFLPERELVATLRASPYVLVPTGSFDRADSHHSFARLSLPSRLPYLAATAGTPALVMGHPDTAAARFVLRHGLGRVVPYQRAALVEAVAGICTPEAQMGHRRAAAALAPALSAEGMSDWIWRSLEAGGPIDHRFAALEHRE
jgi:hypothetical protein